MMFSEIIITPMTMTEFRKKYGNSSDLWDYPLTEIPYLVETLKDGDRTDNRFALVKYKGEYRLFECTN